MLQFLPPEFAGRTSRRFIRIRSHSMAQLGMLAVFAAFERSMIVERVNAGLAAARAKGTRLGRPSRRNPHFDAVAKLRGEGLSGRKIAKQLGIGAALAFKIIGQLKASLN